jgi:hypothetical protein
MLKASPPNNPDGCDITLSLAFFMTISLEVYSELALSVPCVPLTLVTAAPVKLTIP